MTVLRAARVAAEILAVPIGLAASLGLIDALRALPGPSLALALPLRETGHRDGASVIVVLGASALVFGLAASVLPVRGPYRAALLRAGAVLVAALLLQAISLRLVRQADLGLDWSGAIRSLAPYTCALGAALGSAAAARLASSDRGSSHGRKEHPVDGPSTTELRVKIGS
jgi:hypothetical protein